MVEDSTRSPQTESEESQQRGAREFVRPAQQGARAAREGLQTAARSVRQGLEESGRQTRAQFQEIGEKAERATRDMAEGAERTSAAIADETSGMLEELSRLAVLPEVATRNWQAAPEIVSSMLRHATETNLHVMREWERMLGPALFLHMQQRILRQLLHGMAEAGADVLRLSRRLMDATLEHGEASLAFAGQRPRDDAWRERDDERPEERRETPRE